MIKGVTPSGFEYELEEEMLDDWDFLESLRELTTNESAIVDVAKYLLGDEQFKALKTHLRGSNKRLKASVVVQEILYILQNAKAGKNS